MWCMQMHLDLLGHVWPLRNSCERQHIARKGKELAAVIVEPIPANAGLVLPRSGFLEKLRKLTRANEVVLIFDEVITGFRVAAGGVRVLSCRISRGW